MELKIEDQIKAGELERSARWDLAEEALATAESEADAARKSLAEWRWHWTADPDNADKVTQKIYAEYTNVSQQQVSIYARGWAKFSEKSNTLSLSDCLLRVRFSDSKWQAVQRVAALHQVTPGTAVQKYSQEIRALVEREEATHAQGDTKPADKPVVATVTTLRPETSSAPEPTDVKGKTSTKGTDKVELPALPTPPKLTSVPMEEAQWEACSDAEYTGELATVNDALHKIEMAVATLPTMHASSDTIREHMEILENMIERVAKVTQLIKNETMINEEQRRAQ